MGKKAIAAGHICIDITPVFPDSAPDAEQPGDIIRAGELVQMCAPVINTGGPVANTGLAMKLMGADVRLLGKIGRDDFGGMIRRVLNRYGAGEDLIEEDGATTSYSIVISVPGTDRCFLHCPGANDTFCAEDIPESAFDEAALFHFGYPPVMRRMYENGGAELVRLFRMVKEKGLATSLDMCSVDPASDAGRADWQAILADVLPYVDFFCPSFGELLFMLDREYYEEFQRTESKEDRSGSQRGLKKAEALADRCLAMGAGAVFLKCGVHGIFLKTSRDLSRTGERLALDPARWNHFRAFEESFFIERVASGTGAGDVSIAAFLTGILRGLGPEESLRYAAAEGALCCTAYDAISGIESFEEIQRRIEKGWKKRKELQE